MFTIVYFLISLAIAFGKDLRIDLSQLDKRAVGLPNSKTGELVAKWSPKDGINVEELGEYAQGDILFVPGYALARNGLLAESKRWLGGIIPFEIDGNFNMFDIMKILSAMDDYHMFTCIKFMPRTGKEKDYLSITDSSSGCWSFIGRIGGKQTMNLQAPSCLTWKGTVIHELMHVVGFLHEQSREDRDDYVNIMWSNINKNYENNFNKAQKGSTNDFGMPYDYGSVLHYSKKAFSANGQNTIVPRNGSGSTMGQRTGFSPIDISKINRMYNCK